MTIDSDGNLWVAVFGGGRVLKVDGSKSETLLDTIDIPAEQVTSVAFGGKNLDELYVTTAAVEIQNKKPVRPVDGAVYKVTGTGSKGLPGASFKL
jgi:gluconolactonase